MFTEVIVDFGDQLGIVRTIGIQPNYDCRSSGIPSSDRKLDPIFYCSVLHRTHSPKVTALYFMLNENIVVLVKHFN